MIQLYYKFLVLFFYHVGDIACRFQFQWTFDLYQKSMNLSCKYDEKNNFQFWKKPTTNSKDL